MFMAKFLYSTAHHKPNNDFAILTIINFFVLVLAIGILIYNFFMFGPRDRIIKTYIKGLKDNNFSLIKDVTAKEFESDEAIDEDLAKYGGTNFAFHTNYRSNRENGLAVDTNIYGFKNGKFFKKQITLIGMGDAWYLACGKLKDEYKINKE